MATDQKKIRDDVIRSFEAWNAGDVSLLERLAEELFDNTYVLHDPNFPNLERGPAGFKQFVRQVFKDNSNIHITVDDILGEGDKLAMRFTVRSTNASTGKAMRSQVLVISRYVGDKVAEEWQLGGPPEEA